MNGRELTATEKVALQTCNAWLRNDFRGTIGTIDPAKAIFETQPDRINISFIVEATAGEGGAICSTDGLGYRVLGGNVDGIEVQP